jgi:hypothetical protein
MGRSLTSYRNVIFGSLSQENGGKPCTISQACKKRTQELLSWELQIAVFTSPLRKVMKTGFNACLHRTVDFSEEVRVCSR